MVRGVEPCSLKGSRPFLRNLFVVFCVESQLFWVKVTHAPSHHRSSSIVSWFFLFYFIEPDGSLFLFSREDLVHVFLENFYICFGRPQNEFPYWFSVSGPMSFTAPRLFWMQLVCEGWRSPPQHSVPPIFCLFFLRFNALQMIKVLVSLPICFISQTGPLSGFTSKSFKMFLF